MSQLNDLLQEKKSRQTRKQWATSALLVLSLFVISTVFYNLRLTGITLAGDAHCGIEEHIHTDECYEYILICPLPGAEDPLLTQGQGTEPETDTLEPIFNIGIPIPDTVPEPIFDDTGQATGDTEPVNDTLEPIFDIGIPIPDTIPEPIFDDTGQATGDLEPIFDDTGQLTDATEPIPGETEQADAFITDMHQHSVDGGCYIKNLICEKDEHFHELTCYSNDEADLETPAIWESTFASIYSKNRVDALVEIAKTQVGYHESEFNFRTENGEKLGYTRYGAWYGSPYGKWSSMFTSFCLSYAGFTMEETPYAQSGEAMQLLWMSNGLYHSKDVYTGQIGDIVFFADGLSGIIYDRMPDYIYAVVGDADNRVQQIEISIYDPNILGYGVVPRDAVINHNGLTPFTITASGKFTYEKSMGIAMFARRGGPQNIKDYIEGLGGSFELTLLDIDKKPLVPDENGNLVLKPNTEYLVSITMHTGEENGILPGEYIYDLFPGVITRADEGDIITTDGTNIGHWVVNDSGHINFSFNENTNRMSDVLINVTAGIMFPPHTEVELEGNIHVTVRPEEEIEPLMNVSKWGRGVATDDEGNLINANGESYNHHLLPWGEPTFKGIGYERIYWDVYITGNRENALAGYVITDQITSPNTHYYGPKDMSAGIVVKYYGAELNPEEVHWITLYPDTPGVTWTETGFTYTMPEELHCEDPGCSYKNQWLNPDNIPIEIKGDWVANIDYFSTLRPATENGTNYYTNNIYIDNKTANGIAFQTVSVANASIEKDGVFNGHTGEFQWLVTANIPRQPADSITVPWSIMDLTKLAIDYGVAGDIEGAFYQPVKKMTAYIGNTQYEVPFITDIDPLNKAPLAYCYSYTSDTPVTSMAMYLLRPCNCSGNHNCDTWDEMGGCASGDFWVNGKIVSREYGYCRCWNMEDNVRLVIEYSSPGGPIIEATNGQIGEYVNIVNLNQIKFKYDNGWAEDTYVQHATETARVPVPSVFKKVLVSDPDKENSYIASYTITVNESKLDLSGEKSVTVEDTMSNTLVYVPGTMRVITEDLNGNQATLTYGVDYTLTVGGTGNRLSIEIFDPRALKYSFYYDCRITVPAGQTSLLFDNSAKVTLFGELFEYHQEPKQVTNVAVYANAYGVQVKKMDANINANISLQGARIGFFAENGERILEHISDENGLLTFETDLTKGIFLREHVLYYVQELAAPPGYLIDRTRQYVYFCDHDGPCENCLAMAGIPNGAGALRVESGEPGYIILLNQKGIPLIPETGGNSPLIYYITGLILTLGPIIYIICSRRHKKKGGCYNSL